MYANRANVDADVGRNSICFPTQSLIVLLLKKVCARLKFHIKNFQGSDQSSFVSDDEAFDLSAWQNRFKRLNSELIHSMYFL